MPTLSCSMEIGPIMCGTSSSKELSPAESPEFLDGVSAPRAMGRLGCYSSGGHTLSLFICSEFVG